MHTSDMPADISKFVPYVDVTSIFSHPTIKYFNSWVNTEEIMHPSCQPCKIKESLGIHSARMQSNLHTDAPYDILLLDVVIGNACNLACPFCDSTSSSLINKISKKQNIAELPTNWKTATHKLASSNSISKIISELLTTYKVKQLKLIGGEPFLKENWESIGNILDQDYCKDLEISITSNGTVLNKRILQSLKNTKTTELRISVDSIGSNYEFIRWPHSWKKMEDNLNFLKNNTANNIQISVANLISVLNFEFLPEIEEYFSNLPFFCGYNFDIKPKTSLLHYSNIPNNIKIQVRDRIKNKDLKKMIELYETDVDSVLIQKQFEFFLKHRKLSTAANAVGPMTAKWLSLT